MAKGPANRYQSAQDMRDDCLRAAAGQDVLAAPVMEPVTVAPAAAVAPRVRQDRGRRGAVYALFALVLVGVAIGVALLVRGLLGDGNELVAAPNVVGTTQQEAVLRLADVGLQVGEVTTEFNPAAADTVLEQSPPEGILVQPGGSVDLVVSAGIEQTLVPELVDRSRREAEEALRAAKLEPGEITLVDGNLPEGRVTAVDPPAGRQLDVGTRVNLTVASGRLEVPNVRGQTRDEAAAALTRLGFDVAVELRPDTGEPGRVLEQTPVNSRAARGSTVRITVSEVPPPPEPSPTPTPTAPPEPTQPPPTQPPPPLPSPTAPPA
jgi:serine/threonine-protein kinase